ncbi:MAG: imidazole glycerol phosphate synthase subunit HisH [Helicobacteraceae bacterium]|jgi:glutamine amidotransferase|nr:imidazole glycerol phosphate synthase subunit HisH [Helicobacteraceae bacterium]
MIGVVDYQMGNLASLINSLAKIDRAAFVARKADDLAHCEKLILPGVGAFGDAAKHLKESGLDEAIKDFVRSGRYILGVCLGLQIMFEGSEESEGAAGLGFFKGKVTRFDPARAAHPIKIPHMGWNEIISRRPSRLFTNLADRERLYFVHSYHAPLEAASATSFYGYDFASAVESDNIFGVQPHPEKSHNAGLTILRNFADMR